MYITLYIMSIYDTTRFNDSPNTLCKGIPSLLYLLKDPLFNKNMLER